MKLSKSCQLLIIFIIFQKLLNLAQQVLFYLRGHQSTPLRQQLLNQIFKVNLLEALLFNYLEAVLLQLVLPTALDQLLTQMRFQSLLFACLFKLLLDKGFLDDNL